MGGMTNSILPVLSADCTEYAFTDVSPPFVVQAQHRFARYPFVQYRSLDIEGEPVEQGFDPHSFDLIIASDVLHATQNLRKTLDRVKQLLGPSGTLVLREMTRPWLSSILIFGMLKGFWVFKDYDLRPDQPCLPPDKWKSLLHEAGFGTTICIGDSSEPEQAQHAVILAQGPTCQPPFWRSPYRESRKTGCCLPTKARRAVPAWGGSWRRSSAPAATA